MNKNRTKDVLVKTGKAMVGLIIAVISWLLNIPGWSSFFVWVGVIVTGVVIFTVFYRYEERIDSFENSRPEITVKKVYPKKNQPTVDFVTLDPDTGGPMRYTGGTADFPWVYKPRLRSIFPTTDSLDTDEAEQTYIAIDFVNNPPRRVIVNAAENVIARITYKDNEGNNLLGKEIKGLWEGKEPTVGELPEPDIHYLSTVIPPNGDERTLCVALKNRNDEDCYAYCLESYADGVTFLRNKALRLRGSIITIEVMLSGNNFDDKLFAFRLINPGEGRDLTITEIKKAS